MTARLSLFFSCDKDKQIFHYFLLCIYTICSKSVLSLQHGCTVKNTIFTSNFHKRTTINTLEKMYYIHSTNNTTLLWKNTVVWNNTGILFTK